MSTTFSTSTRADGSVIVAGYTWQCAFPVEVDGEVFWRVGLEAEAYSPDMYFDELDSLEEAVEFIVDGQSDAEMDAEVEAGWKG